MTGEDREECDNFDDSIRQSDEPISELRANFNAIQSMDSRIRRVEDINPPGGLSKRLRERKRHIGFDEPEPATRVVVGSAGRARGGNSRRTAVRVMGRAAARDTRKVRAINSVPDDGDDDSENHGSDDMARKQRAMRKKREKKKNRQRKKKRYASDSDDVSRIESSSEESDDEFTKKFLTGKAKDFTMRLMILLYPNTRRLC